MSNNPAVPFEFQLTVQRTEPVQCASIRVCQSLFPPGTNLVRLGGHDGATFLFCPACAVEKIIKQAPNIGIPDATWDAWVRLNNTRYGGPKPIQRPQGPAPILPLDAQRRIEKNVASGQRGLGPSVQVMGPPSSFSAHKNTSGYSVNHSEYSALHRVALNSAYSAGIKSIAQSRSGAATTKSNNKEVVIEVSLSHRDLKQSKACVEVFDGNLTWTIYDLRETAHGKIYPKYLQIARGREDWILPATALEFRREDGRPIDDNESLLKTVNSLVLVMPKHGPPKVKVYFEISAKDYALLMRRREEPEMISDDDDDVEIVSHWPTPLEPLGRAKPQWTSERFILLADQLKHPDSPVSSPSIEGYPPSTARISPSPGIPDATTPPTSSVPLDSAPVARMYTAEEKGKKRVAMETLPDSPPKKVSRFSTPQPIAMLQETPTDSLPKQVSPQLIPYDGGRFFRGLCFVDHEAVVAALTSTPDFRGSPVTVEPGMRPTDGWNVDVVYSHGAIDFVLLKSISQSFPDDFIDHFPRRGAAMWKTGGPLQRGATKEVVRAHLLLDSVNRYGRDPNPLPEVFSGNVAAKRPYSRSETNTIVHLGRKNESWMMTREWVASLWAQAIWMAGWSVMEALKEQHPGAPEHPQLTLNPFGVAFLYGKFTGAKFGPNEGGAFLVEPWLGSKWTHWTGNTSSKVIIKDDMSLEHRNMLQFLAFLQHLQWFATRCQAFLSDYQGVGTTLSDLQVICSGSGLFGDGNLFETFRDFPTDHQCNDNAWCRHYRLDLDPPRHFNDYNVWEALRFEQAVDNDGTQGGEEDAEGEIYEQS